MKFSSKNLLGLVLVTILILFSSLAFSQDNLNSSKVFQYCVSLYAPQSATRNAGFSMSFGSELQKIAPSIVEEVSKIPERTYFK